MIPLEASALRLSLLDDRRLERLLEPLEALPSRGLGWPSQVQAVSEAFGPRQDLGVREQVEGGGVVALEEVHEVLPAKHLAGLIPGRPDGEPRIVDARGPPPVARPSLGPADLPEPGGVRVRQRAH